MKFRLKKGWGEPGMTKFQSKLWRKVCWIKAVLNIPEVIKCAKCEQWLKVEYRKYKFLNKEKEIDNSYWSCALFSESSPAYIYSSATLLVPEEREYGIVYVVEKEKKIKKKDNRFGTYHFCLHCFEKEF